MITEKRDFLCEARETSKGINYKISLLKNTIIYLVYTKYNYIIACESRVEQRRGEITPRLQHTE